LSKKTSDEHLTNPWTLSTEEIAERLDVIIYNGLDEKNVVERRKKYGSNTLKISKKTSQLVILLRQFRSLLVILLIIASIVALAYNEVLEGISILIVLLLNAFIGYFTEVRAIRSMEALRKMTRIDAEVRREGIIKKIPAKGIVPGDILILDAGDMVAADARIIVSSKLQADESTLTGESVPVSKNSSTLDEDKPLAERRNMLYKGTYLTRGTAEAIVVFTGMKTEMGKISSSIEEVEDEKTPLERKLDELAKKLIPLLVIVAAIVGVTGYLRGLDPLLMVEEAIALAIATVPEGLPIVATLVLARGMLRLAENDVLINNLSSVETLGSTTIICTDKTGTLTENKMTVTTYELYDGKVDVTGTGLETEGLFIDQHRQMIPSEDATLRSALEIGVLCNNASISGEGDNKEVIGEPMEIALLVAGEKGGMKRSGLLERLPEAREVSFDPSIKMMATYHEMDDNYLVAVKGAPEKVLDRCSTIMHANGSHLLTSELRSEWIEKGEEMARSGLRVIALANKVVDTLDKAPYESLSLIGLVGLMDPPRKEVRSAIERCQRAGMRVIMITGDHAATAKSIAQKVGLISSPNEEVVEGRELIDIENKSPDELNKFIRASIFARVTPENKLDIIGIHQRNRSIVAMTGDGVNDAPALKKANIGVAMGIRGTQVAKEASDMILQNDDFTSIVKAVKEGRIIFGNIRKFVIYLISCNLSELIAILIASIIGLPLPLLPLQILFLNVVNDVFPAFALGACRESKGIMDRVPNRSDEPILTHANWAEMSYYGLLISIVTVASFYFSDGMPEAQRITISFLTLAFAQLWHVFTMRAISSGPLKNEITRNAYVWGAILLCTLLLLASVYIPGFSTALSTQSPGKEGWTMIISLSLVPLLAGQMERELRKRI